MFARLGVRGFGEDGSCGVRLTAGITRFLSSALSDSRIDMSNADAKTAQARMLSGSAVLLTGSGLVSAINFTYNVATARFLGPDGFGHATAVYTLLILMSAFTLSFQIVSAKVVAQQSTPEEKSAAFRTFHRAAWVCSTVVAMLLALSRNAIAQYFNLPSPLLVVLLAIGAAFYIPLGSKRGYIQGACSFRELAINVVLEGFVRLCGSLVMIGLGFGVPGVIAANAGAMAIAYLFAIRGLAPARPAEIHLNVAFREGLQAIVFFVGWVAINNCDIVVVKHFFAPTSAGLYAAVALVGRVVISLSWAVISTMFPVAAGSDRPRELERSILGTSLLLVFAIGATVTLALRLAPAALWTGLFGSRFMAASGHNLPFLLSFYAATTTVYALSVTIIAYEMSHKIANTGWLQLAVTIVLVAGMYRFHASLEQVIRVQLDMMAFLLFIVAMPFFLSLVKVKRIAGGPGGTLAGELRIIRRVSEDEVIAEFLKADFRGPEFEDYQKSLSEIVVTPNLAASSENALRRALLFIRHGALWRELPKGTEWFEVEVSPADLPCIRVFPRAHWRKLARGNFAVPGVVQSVAARFKKRDSEEAFLTKIRNLSMEAQQDSPGGAVLLIGLNENGPFTLLDGNHRVVASLLVSPATLKRFRFYCGLSSRMAECCWYETNTATLFRYAANLVRHITHDPEMEVERLLQNS